MSKQDQREILTCLGGPLHKVRLSVPFGLRWFELARNQIEDPVLAGDIAIEKLTGELDSSTFTVRDKSDSTDSASVYVRKSFVTGEAGLIEVFSYQ